jgi:type IV pilus assembly protein PilO
MKLEEYQNLDPSKIGTWPLPAKIGIVVIVCAGILFATWHYDIQEQQQALDRVERKEAELRKTFEDKQRKAANLDALKQQMQEMEESFGDMLRQLPNRTEVAALLVDISQTGLAAGLEFDLFRPGNERPSEFYAELPIEIRVTGNYHELGEFVSGVATLPRIVTTHNINITPASGGKLNMSAIARTYRALEEDEL